MALHLILIRFDHEEFPHFTQYFMGNLENNVIQIANF